MVVLIVNEKIDRSPELQTIVEHIVMITYLQTKNEVLLISEYVLLLDVGSLSIDEDLRIKLLDEWLSPGHFILP